MRLHIVLALLAVDYPHFAAFYIPIKLVFPDSSVLAGAPPVTYIPVTAVRLTSTHPGANIFPLIWDIAGRLRKPNFAFPAFFLLW